MVPEIGMAHVDDPLGVSGWPVAEYYHTDTLGSTRIMTGGSNSPFPGLAIPGTEASYTAFGRRVCALDGSCAPSPPPHRFGYAGAYGYQAPTAAMPGDPYATDFPFLHVGARYYNPTTGRFLQRDPIGIAGGTNVYAYVHNKPMSYLDPAGLDFKGAIQDATAGAAIGGSCGGAWGAVAGGVSGGPPGAVAGGIAGGMLGYCTGWCSGFAGHYLADWVFDRHPAPPPPSIPTPPPAPPRPPLVGPPNPSWAV